MTAQPSSPFDISPILKMYTESMELWKKNYENMMKNAKDTQGAFGANGTAQVTHSPACITPAFDAASSNRPKSVEDLFKRFVQNQIELCHFFGSRWEQYLKLSDQLSQCRSPTELANLQSAFLSQFAKDYMHETEKLAHPVAELMTNWGGEKK